MTAKQLTDSILQMAIQGKLVPQDPNDEPASVLLERIREEKKQLVKKKVLKKKELKKLPYPITEAPFDKPSGWEFVRLITICTKFSTGPFGTMLHKSDYCDVGTPLINPTNIKEGKVDETGIRRVNNQKYTKLDSYVVHKDDIILARRGDLSKCAIITEKEEGWLAGTGSFFLKNLGYNPKFFRYLYASKYVQSHLKEKNIGMTMDNLNQSLLAETILPLPPKEEQIRIVKRIEEILPVIKEYGEAYNEASKMDAELPDKLKKSILQEAIKGKLGTQTPSDEPASALLNKIRAEKQKLVEEGILKKKDLEEIAVEEDEIPQKLIEGWEYVKLSTVISLIDGTKREGDFVCLDARFLRGKSTGEKLSKGKFVRQNDNIILVDGENSGEVFIVPCEGYMGSTFKQLWVSEVLYLHYVLYFIKANKDLLRNSKKGAAIPHLNKELFYNLIIGIPPLAEQSRIVQKIEELYAEIDNMTTNNININETEEKE